MNADSTPEFFHDLHRRGREPLLRKVTGTARFDIVDPAGTDQWFLTIREGELGIAPGSAAADAVMRADRATFQRILTGDMNIFAAVLRGAVVIEGDRRLLVLLQRLFPRPESRRNDPRSDAGGSTS